MKLMSNPTIVVILVLILVSSAIAQNSVFSPEMQVKIKLPGAIELSPDGARVAFTVSEAVMTADRSEFVTQIWIATTDGKGAFQVTFGDKSASNPKFSPDGNWLAFTAARGSARANVFLLRLGGGEAEQITDLKGSASSIEWSPNGNSIAFTMSDPKTDDEEKNDKSRNDFRWVNENVKMTRLYVVPVAKDANGKREVRKLTTENYNVGSFDWSPDGTKIVFNHTISPVANEWPSSDISIFDFSAGRATILVNSNAAETSPIFSPDGSRIAYSESDVPVRWAQSNRIQIIRSTGGKPIQTAPLSFDAQPGMFGWNSNGSSIFFSEAKGTKTGVYSLNVQSNQISDVPTDDAVRGSFALSRDSSSVAFVMQSSVMPPEVYFGSVSDLRRATKLSNFNADIAKMTMPRTELVKWKSPDGREIEGLLTYPIGYRQGQKVPLILNIHGGPAGVFQHAFVGGRGVYPLATFAQRGYAILRPNPRGSSGYGTEFRRANIKDWGGKDYQDLMAGVDLVIRMGVTDADRLGVMGWSYGGFMTSWIVTQTKRFKAASAGAPVTNLMSFNGTADIPDFVPDYFGAQFWEDPAIYMSHSAMFNVKGVTTPTLIQHGEADIRVPISQGYEFYNALRAQGVPTRMIVLPRQPHGPNEPRMQLAAMQSNLEWFAKYLPAN